MKKAYLLYFALTLFSSSPPLLAQVFINGQLVQGNELLNLQLLVGEPIPPGNYWLDTYGNWGYIGNNQAQGNIYGAHQGNAGSNSNKSYSSHYSPGGAGGGGSYASDGECSIFSIDGMSVTSGNC